MKITTHVQPTAQGHHVGWNSAGDRVWKADAVPCGHMSVSQRGAHFSKQLVSHLVPVAIFLLFVLLVFTLLFMPVTTTTTTKSLLF